MPRPVSAETTAVRALLDQKKGEVTAQEALPILAAQTPPITVTEVQFNGIKQVWKKVNGVKVNRKPKAAPTLDLATVTKEAIAFVVDNGGLAKVKAELARQTKLVQVFESIMAQASKAA
jgi:hypothetical protein